MRCWNTTKSRSDWSILPALANFRKAFAHGGGKNDPTDAMLLAEFLQKHFGNTRTAASR